MKKSNEARVGAVVFLALVTMAGGYLFLRGMGRGGDSYEMIIAEGAANIQPGSDVRLRGVKIGEVRDVALDPATQKPLLTLAIKQQNPPIALLKDYQYTLRSGSLIGDNYIDIRGDYSPTAAKYDPDSSEIIPAVAAGGVTDLASQVGDIGGDFRQTLSKLNITIDRINKGVLSYENQIKLARALDGVARLTRQVGQGFGPNGVKVSLGDQEAQRQLNETLRNAAEASRNINGLTRDFQGVTRNVNQVTRNANNVTSEFGGVARDLRGVIGGSRGEIQGLLANLNGTARNVNGLTETLAFVVKQGGLKENAAAAFRSLNQAAANVEAGSRSFRVLGEPQTQQALRETIGALRDTTGSLRDTAATVNRALNDPTNQEQLGSTLRTLSETATALKGTVQNLNDITGSLKGVVADPQVQTNLKETVANLNGTLAATRVAAERVGALLGAKKPRNGTTETGNSNGNTSNDNGEATTKPAKAEVGAGFPSGVDFTVRRYTGFKGDGEARDDGRTFGDLTLNTSLFGRPVRAGVSGIGEGGDLTLQTGQYVGNNAMVRYGLYRSKLGIGGEVRKGKLSLEGNLYDPNDASYNGYLGYQISPNIEILAGHEKLGGVRTNAIGVRLR